MDRRTLRTPGWDCGRRSLLYRSGGRAHQTWKYLGPCAQQVRSELSQKSSGRLPRSQNNQRTTFLRSLAKLTQDSIPASKFDKRPGQPFAWHDEGSERVDPKTGWRWYTSNPPASSSSSGWQPSSWWQASSWDEQWFFFWSKCQGVSFAGNGASVASDGMCTHYTKPTHTSHPVDVIYSRVAQDLSHRVHRNRCVSPHLAQHVARALVVVSFTLEHDLTFHMHSSPTCYPTIFQTLIDVYFTLRFIHRMSLSAPWAKRTRPQVMSPRISLKRTPLCWSNRHSSTDRVWRRLLIQLRALRLTLLNRIWMMRKYGTCWLHRCTYRREKQVPTDHSFITPSDSSRFRTSAARPAEVFSHKRKSSQESHSDRDGIPLAHRAVWGENEALSRLSDLEEAARLVLEEQRDHLLAEAKSEILKQECKVDTLNNCIREFPRQAHSNRLEMDCKLWVWRNSKRAGEASRTIGSTRKCTSGNSHEKSPWCGRIEESSGDANWRITNWERVRLLLRSSLHKYKSCRKERIVWMILENFKMQNQSIFAVENYPTFPVNRQLFQVYVGCWAATKVCDLIHGICLLHRETFLTVHVQFSIRYRLLTKECFILGIKVLQAKPSAR